MYKIWEKKSQEEIKSRVFGALDANINYDEEHALGVPASYLDSKVFSQDEAFIKEAPFISTLVKNPNHIGCHTLGKSESYFKGTQSIEKELIELCAVDILGAEEGKTDGYVASGGTEANLQAIWIFRNFFQKEFNASLDEICILCSEDSHYSMDKAGNVFVLDVVKVPVNQETRELSQQAVAEVIENARNKGKKYFITICNMMTTMFGSIDNIDCYTEALKAAEVEFMLHVDGAYGGFYYPFTEELDALTFANPDITSFTLDAHKMAQAPYGTGIFLIRKGFIGYANTEEASYVEGEDFTLIGSRSGANAIAVWMILMKNGPFGWQEKVFILQKRAEWICEQLDQLSISYYRHSNSNIVAIDSSSVSADVAKEYGLVPDNHDNPLWFKIVVMEHVTIEKASELVDAIKALVTGRV